MIGLWRILTAVAFATHILVGCCAHHAHACEGANHSDQEHAATHGDCPGDRDSHSDRGQHGKHDCQENACSFVLLSHSTDGSISCGRPLHGSYLPLHDVLPSQAGNSCGQCFSPPDHFLLPVRLHLAKQVLLI